MAVQPIPDGYTSITPYLVVEGAERLIEFLVEAFGGQERLRSPMPDGSVGHAEVEIGGAIVMLADATDGFEPTHSQIRLYVEDVDGVYAQAVQAGGLSQAEPEDQFYGDRIARVRDAFGNQVVDRDPHRGRVAGRSDAAHGGVGGGVVAQARLRSLVCVGWPCRARLSPGQCGSRGAHDALVSRSRRRARGAPPPLTRLGGTDYGSTQGRTDRQRRISRAHLGAYLNQRAEVELVAVCDIVEEAAQSYAKARSGS